VSPLTANATELTFTASATAAIGAPVTVTLTGTGGTPALTRTTTISLTVIAQSDFTISVPASRTVARGSCEQATVGITTFGGFSGTIAFSTGALPAGVTATFSPTSVASPVTGSTTSMLVCANATAALATSSVTVIGTSGTLVRNAVLSVTVTQASSFTLSAAPASVSVARSATATSTIGVTRTNFATDVILSIGTLPTGVTAAFAPNPVLGTGTGSTLTFTASATAATGGPVAVTITGTGGTLIATTSINLTVTGISTTNTYTQRFLDMYAAIKAPTSGYFLQPQNIPYHSVETLMVEAPDHGHETTSEAYSFWAWLEVARGRVTGDWSGLQSMFDSMEANIIPTPADQPTNGFYNAGDPADYAPEFDVPELYPAPIDANIDTGSDPIGPQLEAAYGNKDMYAMHWIIDVDNFYGYGRRGDRVSKPSYMNTFQRGPQESTWETIPQPSWENFMTGGNAAAGFLPLFISGPAPARQWRYTNAPDADARLIQAMYWANQFAPTNPTVASLSVKAAKMGDYLRYAFFDKYFKTMGCSSPQCPAGNGYNGAHFLLSWYYAWGGPIPPEGGWSFRIGSSHNHFGYQNLMAALALTTVPALRPRSSNGVADWTTSLGRQIEFYRWLQSADGGIAGGATNSLGGRYLAPAAGTPTFYGMWFQTNPVYLDPGSNTWFGFQVWSMERVAEYYEETGNDRAKMILDKWIPWAMGGVQLPGDGTFKVPSTLTLSGQPSTNWNATAQNWNANDAAFNANLRVQVFAPDSGTDLGVASALAKTLMFYSAGTRRWTPTQHVASQLMAKELLDRMWTLFRDPIGISAPEVRKDYNRFDDPIRVAPGFTGVMANGDPINASSTFLSIRSQYRLDPDFPKVQAFLADQNNAAAAPTLRYHRFWAQADFALANAEYGRLFP
jgi:hypothetical protein